MFIMQTNFCRYFLFWDCNDVHLVRVWWDCLAHAVHLQNLRITQAAVRHSWIIPDKQSQSSPTVWCYSLLKMFPLQFNLYFEKKNRSITVQNLAMIFITFFFQIREKDDLYSNNGFSWTLWNNHWHFTTCWLGLLLYS